MESNNNNIEVKTNKEKMILFRINFGNVDNKVIKNRIRTTNKKAQFYDKVLSSSL